MFQNIEHSPNRKYKASVFTSLFSEPSLLLELYNALNKTDCPPDTPVTIATLDDALFMDRVNDLAFVVDGKVVILVEHQSTINENMPFRFLAYLVRVYENLFDNRTFYKHKLVKIPYPEFVVLYNGKEKMPETVTLRLSDAFESSPEVADREPPELSVTVYNINDGHNAELLERSKTLGGYAAFIAKVREQLERGVNLTEAITQAVSDCVKADILAEFLRKNSKEVINMLTREWDWGVAEEVWREEAYETGVERGMERGMERGIERGVERAKLDDARRMLADNLSAEQIAKFTLLPLETIERLRGEE
jgi:predicted transposase/invertase (TIGR01784 family)